MGDLQIVKSTGKNSQTTNCLNLDFPSISVDEAF